MNNQSWNNPYGYYNYGQQFTNTTYVISLEEALSRSNMRNSEIVYFHQDKPVFYRIRVDQDGRKHWQEFSYDIPKQVDNAPVVKQDLLALEERIKNIENMLFKEVSNEQPNGQVSIPTEPYGNFS
jgi:hypothetical protein